MARPGGRRWPARLALIAVAAALLPGLAPDAGLADEIRDAQWHVDYLDLTTAHAISRGDGVTVAVIDSGVDGSHQDLRDNLLPGIDLVAPGNENAWTPEDHGTLVTGVLAGHGHGPDRGDGVIGVAPGATVLPIRTSTDDDDREPRARLLADGIEYAVEHGASVISISLSTDPSEIDQRAIEAARRSDVVVVAAAGNRPDAEAVTFPAALPTVVAVGAVDRDGGLAEFSVTGPEIALSAPGHEIVSTRPGDEYAIVSGTSAAAPVVAGAAALVRAAFPELTADQVTHRLIATADDAGPPGFNEQYGHGIVNVVAALTAELPPMPPAADEPDQIRDSQWHLPALALPQAHELTRGVGVTVALVGPGVAGDHPDLHHNLLPGVDLADPANPDAWTPTVNGTAYAGLIAGHGNRLADHEPGNRGVLGLAPGATVLPVRTSGAGRSDEQAVELAIAGIERAIEDGAQVICYAGGIASQDVFAEVIEAAAAADVLIVAPAGGAPAGELWYPAANPAVLTAVALDPDGEVAPDQLPEPQPTGATPGAPTPAWTPPFGPDSAEVGPLLAVPGAGLTSTAPDATYTDEPPASAAAAAVLAGAAALVRAAHPELTAHEVTHRLVVTADSTEDRRLDLLAALTAEVPPPTDPPPAGGPPPGDGPGTGWSFGWVVLLVLVAAGALAAAGGIMLGRSRGHPQPPG